MKVAMSNPSPDLPNLKDWVEKKDSTPFVYGVERRYVRYVDDPLNAKRRHALHLAVLFVYDAGPVGIRWDVAEVRESEVKIIHYEAILLEGKENKWFIGEPGMGWRVTQDKDLGLPLLGIYLSLGLGENFKRIYIPNPRKGI